MVKPKRLNKGDKVAMTLHCNQHIENCMTNRASKMVPKKEDIELKD